MKKTSQHPVESTVTWLFYIVICGFLAYHVGGPLLALIALSCTESIRITESSASLALLFVLLFGILIRHQLAKIRWHK